MHTCLCLLYTLKINYEKYIRHIKGWPSHTGNHLHYIVMNRDDTILNVLSK
jgi:hypothetical protein